MAQYQAKTGKSELARKDWTTKDRKSRTRQWKEACLYNFSYQGGAKEYTSMEQRTAFYNWVAKYLKSKGHEIVWPQAQAELGLYTQKTQRIGFNNDIKLFLAATNKVVFDTAFTLLQEVKNQGPIVGMEADQWDKDMAFFEQTAIYQPLIVRMEQSSVDKLNKIMHRKGFAVFSIPAELKLTGDVAKAEDRISWEENRLYPFAKGDALSKRELKNREKLKSKEKKVKKKKDTPKRKAKAKPAKPAVITEP